MIPSPVPTKYTFALIGCISIVSNGANLNVYTRVNRKKKTHTNNWPDILSQQMLLGK